jgi:hypothetical protein
MTFFQNLWRDLVDKRLWPVAAALLLGLVAVPFLIDTGSPTPAASAVAVVPGVVAAPVTAQIAVAAAPDGAQVERSGTSRDPFKPLVFAKVPKAATTAGVGAPAKSAAGVSAPSAGVGVPSRGGGAKPAPKPTTTPTTATTTPPPATTTTKTKLFSYAIAVAVKRAGRTTTLRGLRAITYLPSAAYPLATFLGVKADGKTATFLLSDGVGVIGTEKHCQPAATRCGVLELKAGENVVLARTPKLGEPVKRFRLILRRVALREVVPAKQTAATRKRAATRAAATTGPGFPTDLAPSRQVTRTSIRR